MGCYYLASQTTTTDDGYSLEVVSKVLLVTIDFHALKFDFVLVVHEMRETPTAMHSQP